jgi:PAS domain S-box-containing protein
MDDNEAVDISEEVGKFAETYSAFNSVINKLQRQYLTLKETYSIQSEQLQAVNQTLQSLINKNGAVTDFLNSILHSILSGVIAVDETGQVTLLNPTACRLLGVSVFKPTGGRWHYDELFISELGKAHSAIHTMRSGESFDNAEKTIRTQDGRILLVTVCTSLLRNYKGEITGAVELIHDISKIRRMEDELSRMKILASLGEMAASVAHEIRNPLGGVSGFAALLARDLSNEPAKREMAEKIVAGVGSINHTIETLLDFARHESAHRTPIRAKEYLESIIETFADEYGYNGSGIRPINKIEIDSNVIVNLDAHLFKQAIYNLIKNGIESGHQDPTIVVGCHLIPDSGMLDLDCGNVALEIYVEDNGMGISDEDIKKIFSPFYSTKQNGTGLGLSIAWKIVKAHGGEIQATSQIGQGTKFSIFLPAKPGPIGG